MRLRREDVLEIHTALTMAAAYSGTTNYNYAVARNAALIDAEAKSVQAAITPSKRFLEWDQRRTALCQKWADRDADGNIVKDGGRYVVVAHSAEFDEEIKALNKEYSAEIDAQDHKNREDTAFLQEEIDIPGEFRKIKFDEIPRELTGKVLRPLLCMISEPGD